MTIRSHVNATPGTQPITPRPPPRHAGPARHWKRHAFGFLVVAVLVHLLAVWAAPHLVMRKVMQLMQAQPATPGAAAGQAAQGPSSGPIHAPPVTARSRTVVMPSPDMLYSVCSFDVSRQPLHIRANPALSSYWSVALYASNTDNFFVRNDRQQSGQPLEVLLVSPHGPRPPGDNVVVAPTDTGVVLMRVLTGDWEAEKATLEPARRTLQCSGAATVAAS